MLQERLELSTFAFLCRILTYKYDALTDCATGAGPSPPKRRGVAPVAATSVPSLYLNFFQLERIRLRSSVVEHWSCKPGVESSILSEGSNFSAHASTTAGVIRELSI